MKNILIAFFTFISSVSIGQTTISYELVVVNDSTSYYKMVRVLTPHQLSIIEESCNQAIANNNTNIEKLKKDKKYFIKSTNNENSNAVLLFIQDINRRIESLEESNNSIKKRMKSKSKNNNGKI